jgi:hypothetical protein
MVPGRFTLNMGKAACLAQFAGEYKRVMIREGMAVHLLKLKKGVKSEKARESPTVEHAKEAIGVIFAAHFEDGGVPGVMSNALVTVRQWYEYLSTVVVRSSGTANKSGTAHSERSKEVHYEATWQIIMRYMLKFTVAEDEGAPVAEDKGAPVAAVWEEGEAEGRLQDGEDAKGEADCDTDAVTPSPADEEYSEHSE